LDEITEMQIHLQAKLLRVLQEKMVDRVGGVQPVNVDVRVIATTNRNASESVEKGEFRQDLFYRLNTIPIVIPPLRHRMNDLGELCQHFIKKYCKIDGRNVKGVTKLALERLTRHNFSGNVRELENIIHRAVLLSLSGKIEPGDLMLDTLPSGDSEGQVAMDVAPPMPSSLKEMEQQMIFKTLDQTEGNRTHAAKILGISVRTLRNKLNEYKENH
ncbi:MAG: sigma 54-interacting transcriptional regulator, partial [Desulfovibrionales bacterium]|nr:sigma 54-interacting transcriptional regulator [Desulfovibrionales bacterium]